jgi:hypothetical protein
MQKMICSDGKATHSASLEDQLHYRVVEQESLSGNTDLLVPMVGQAGYLPVESMW